MKKSLKYTDFTNQKINHLTCIERIEDKIYSSGVKKVRWLCQCDCGKYRKVEAFHLSKKTVRSCGCIKNYLNINRKYDLKESSFRAKAASILGSAKNRGKEMKLSITEISEKIKQNCFYCKTEPTLSFNTLKNRRQSEKDSNNFTEEYIKKATIYYNGLDRIDSSKGYTLENTVTCCKTCNFAKNDLTQQEFYNWIQKVYREFKL